MEPIFTITELAEALDVTPRAIRLYEDKGLLDPRRAGKTRVYGADDRNRLERILRAKRLGLSLRKIGEFLELHDRSNGTTPSEIQPRIRKLIEQFETQRDDLETTIAELRDLQGR